MIDSLMHMNIDIFSISRTGENEISFMTGLRNKRRVRELLDRSRNVGIRYDIELMGLPRLLYLYRKRMGLAAGILLSIVLLMLSGMFVWTIDIRGNIRLTDGEVREMLRRSGFYEGMLISDSDADRIRVNVINDHPEISYITFFISGTHALVTVSERELPPDTSKDNNPYNLVAKRDGVITGSVVSEGMTVVKKGDFVKKGDLLVSGIVELQTTSYKAVHAKGEVYAQTYREFSVDIPYSSFEKEYTGREKYKRSIDILGFDIPLFLSPDSGYEKYDAFKRTENAVLWDCIRLPFRINETLFAEYETKLCHFTREEAEKKAFDAYKKYIERELNVYEKIKEEVEVTETDNGIELRCMLWCIEDIALQKPIASREITETKTE